MKDQTWVGINEAGQSLGVSRSTIWRLIRRGELPNVRRGGRRLIPAVALRKNANRKHSQIPPFRLDHPMFRLLGAGRSGGRTPGARDKHAILDR